MGISSAYRLIGSSGVLQPTKAPTTPPVAAPQPAMAVASGPAMTRPESGKAIVAPTAAVSVAMAPNAPPFGPPYFTGVSVFVDMGVRAFSGVGMAG